MKSVSEKSLVAFQTYETISFYVVFDGIFNHAPWRATISNLLSINLKFDFSDARNLLGDI